MFDGFSPPKLSYPDKDSERVGRGFFSRATDAFALPKLPNFSSDSSIYEPVRSR